MGRGKEYKKAAKVPKAPKHKCPKCGRQFVIKWLRDAHIPNCPRG